MSRFGTAIALAHGTAVVLAAVFFAAPAHADTVNLPVPKAVIYPGEVVDDKALVERPFKDSWAARLPICKQRSDLVGKVARRTLMPGQPVGLSSVHVPDAVTQGKSYRIVFSADGLVISSTAVALTSGAVGDLVTLRNPDSGSVVRGIVSADGTIRMSSE